LKAVRHAIESFLPQVAARNVLMREDNHAVFHILAGLTSRTHVMMDELRRLWCLLDTNNINIIAHNIMSTANVWADKLSRHLESDDWRLDPVLFAELDMIFGHHSIDRFDSALNILLARYNAGWKDPTCEAVDALHLPDNEWRRESNWCNPLCPLLPNLVQKTTTGRRSGYRSRPSLDRESLAPSAYRDGFRRNYHLSPSRLVPTKASGATRYKRQSALANDNIPRSLPAWLYVRRGAVSATLALFTGLHREPRILHQQEGRK
jgi:hypothetical protein